MSDKRIMVVGTTSDYIDMIARRYPGRALFLTDLRERSTAREPAPPPGDELLVDLTEPGRIPGSLAEHLSRRQLDLCGVVAYDCESLAFAARLAESYNLPFPSVSSILLLRDKYRTKQIWQAHDVPCPKTALVRSEAEALDFLADVAEPIVLKPLTGSGSELTFRCNDVSDTRRAFRLLSEGLAQRANSRMYAADASHKDRDPLRVFAAEEFVSGPEYSSDFVIEDGEVTIIRTAFKIKDERHPFGIASAYELPASLPQVLTVTRLKEWFRRAAEAAGLRRAICMVDFMVRDGAPMFLELTPRPGGDCLPPLIRRSCGLDMLELAMDFAERREWAVPPANAWKRLVGVRLFASYSGRLRKVDFPDPSDDPSLIECYLKRAPGHRISLPPDDYDSWLLGHVIFQPSTDRPLWEQCRSVAARVRIDIQPDQFKKTSESYNGARRRSAAADTTA